MKVDWSAIESKWKNKWNAKKEFETNVNDKEKKFITVAYPYPNSPQHIGHGRTYTLADIHARYYRMKGYNVLFPMGFHYTGTPILGMSKRVKAGDSEIIDGLKNIYKVPEKDIAKAVSEILGGSGGGNTRFAQGGGKNKDKKDDAIKKAKSMVLE